MRIDTLSEWLVIAFGIGLAIGVIYPTVANKIGSKISEVVPEPSEIAKWLRDHGL